MNLQRAFPLPRYTEEALGYDSQHMNLWVGVYLPPSRQVIWDDGVEVGEVDPALVIIFAKLWGPLPTEYGYLLDRTQRIVHVLRIEGLQLFLETRDRHKASLGGLSSLDDTAALVASLVAYAENPVEVERCSECYHGYGWIEGLQVFLPCAWCNADNG